MNIKKMLFQRYILYPIIIGFITYYILETIANTPMRDAINQFGLYGMIDQMLGIRLSYDQGIYIYSYVVGFAYGTLSQFFKIHKMRIRLFTIFLAMLKYYMCFYVFSTIAFFWIPVELLLIIVLFVFILPFKKKKRSPSRVLN